MPDHHSPQGDDLDLFAGAGGWDVGARELGLDPLGIELNEDACKTREAAGLRTLHADIAALDPMEFAPCRGLIASPPCPSFSRAGKRLGLQDLPIIYECVQRMLAGEDPRSQAWHDERSALTLEPLRWALALRPEWIAFEQVPDVLPVWEHFAHALRTVGYMTWTGCLYAEQYGVPQTRERAFLMASRVKQPQPPAPTHQRFSQKHPPAESLCGTVRQWVSMAEALGWGMTERPAHTVTSGGVATGGAEPFGNGARKAQRAQRALGAWAYRSGAQRGQTVRLLGQPAPAIYFGNDSARAGWVTNGDASDIDERIDEREAAILQGFPADHSWQGSRSSRFLQIGNAVPPPMARAVLASLIA